MPTLQPITSGGVPRPLAAARDTLQIGRQSGWNDYVCRTYEQDIQSAEADAVGFADSFIENTVVRANAVGTEAHAEYEETTAEAQALTEAIRTERIDTKEARKKLDRLRRHHTRASRRREEFERATERIAEVEADKLAYGEDFINRHPDIWPEFPA